MSRVVTVSIKIAIDEVEKDYITSPMSLGNFEQREEAGVIVSQFGDLEIDRAFFLSNWSLKKEYDVEIKNDDDIHFSGYAYRFQTTIDKVVLRLVEDYEDVDLLNEYECVNCEEETYLRPLLFGNVKAQKLPLLNESNREYLLPEGGFATKSYSGSTEIGSSILNSEKISLWNEPLRDVCFDFTDGAVADYTFNTSSVNLSIASGNLSYSVPLAIDTDFQIFGRLKNIGVFEPLLDIAPTPNSGTFPLSAGFSGSLTSVNIWEFKTAFFNKTYRTFNNYKSVSVVELTTTSTNRIDDIETSLSNSVTSLTNSIGVEASARASGDNSIWSWITERFETIEDILKIKKSIKVLGNIASDDFETVTSPVSAVKFNKRIWSEQTISAGTYVDTPKIDNTQSNNILLDKPVTVNGDISLEDTDSLKNTLSDFESRISAIETFLEKGLLSKMAETLSSSNGGMRLHFVRSNLTVTEDIYTSIYATFDHTHTEYAPATHTHTGYASSSHTHQYTNGLVCGSGGASCGTFSTGAPQ